MLIASYLFYAAWNPPFLILLWISTLVDWVVGKKLIVQEVPRTKKYASKLTSLLMPIFQELRAEGKM
jgi:hypothetical protein